LGPGIEAELSAFREHLSRGPQRARNGRGARELLAFLAETGRPLQGFRPEDLAAFKAWISSRHPEAKGSWAWALVEGDKAYLRWKACQGFLVEDEELFFALNERITSGVQASAEGESLRARVLREVAAFGETLAGVGRVRRRAFQRAAVKLIFVLSRSGKDVSAIALEDWRRFEDEVTARQPRIAERILTGARAYLRFKGREGALEKERVPPARHDQVEALAQLSPEAQREVVSFRERLRACRGASATSAYTAGVRELLLFLEERGNTAAAMTAADFVAFQEEIRARVARGELGASMVTPLLCGVRLYLREKAAMGEVTDVALIEAASPLNNRRLHALLAAHSAQEAELAREVEGFRERRMALGYGESSPQQRGARRLLRFLAARGRNLVEITKDDWNDFKRQVTSDGRVFNHSHPVLVGAAAYLRMKARQGVIGDDQVPKVIVRRRVAPELPPSLAACLRLLDEAMAAQDFAANTRPTYRRALRDFLVWLKEEHAVTEIAEVTRDVVTAYRLSLQARASVKGTPYALYTQIGILTALRFFFSWLVKTGRLLTDPTIHLPRPRRPQHLPRSLKVSEVARVIASLPTTTLGLRDRALVELLYGTGMRRSEVSRLRLDDIDLEQRVILIREGKGRKDRVVPLGKKAKQVLLDYLEHGRVKLLRGKEQAAVFLGRRGERLSESQVTHRVAELGLKVHLKMAPHVLRHSCATHLLKGRADIRHIQRLLGHKSLQTTERYTKVEVADLREVIQRCHPREKGKPEVGA
jgi:integrase/recombinase XerD